MNDDAIDVYTPSGGTRPCGAVIIVAGYPDAGFERIAGCKFKEMPSNVAWAKRIAASGLVAVAYSNREPVADLHAVIRHVRESLGIERIGLWASSGNAPLAVSALPLVRCAALLYPYTIEVPEAARKYGFVTPDVPDFPADVPLFVVRAGQDAMPGLNETLTRFVRLASERNVPLTYVNLPAAPHAFDVADDGETTREVIEQVLAFLRRHLC